MSDFLNPDLPHLNTDGLTTTHLTFGESSLAGYTAQVDSDMFSPSTDLYTINLTSGHSYEFQVLTLNEPGTTILYAPDGSAVVLNNDADDISSSLQTDMITNFNAPTSGEYTLYTELSSSGIVRVLENELSSYQQTSQYLSQLGLSIEVAQEFIINHLDAPSLIFSAAEQNGVTNQMLADIVGVEQSVVQDFWTNSGFDYSLLG